MTKPFTFFPRLLATLAVGATLFAAGPAMAGLSLSRGDAAQQAEVAADVTNGSATPTVESAPADQATATKVVARRRDEDAASAQYPQAKAHVARASNYTARPVSRAPRQVAQFQAAPVRVASQAPCHSKWR
jgi:hypothetical protein